MNPTLEQMWADLRAAGWCAECVWDAANAYAMCPSDDEAAALEEGLCPAGYEVVLREQLAAACCDDCAERMLP